ncbi:MAG: redoxin domain-containing protein [Acidobacteriota bacterium]
MTSSHPFRHSVLLLALIISLALWGSTVVGDDSTEHHHHHAPSTDESGTATAETIELIGVRALTIDGDIVRIGLEKRARPVALVFLDDGCMISRRYVPRLNQLHKEAEAVGVELYAVMSNPEISWQNAKTFRDEFELALPLIHDANGVLAKQVRPKIVPSAFVVDVADRLVYRGRIDDRFPSLTKVRPEAREHDLLNAMQAVTAGRVEEQTRTTAIGCVFVDWPEKNEEPVYTSHVAPILNANCVSCHSDAGVAPFVLDSYTTAKRWSKMITIATSERLMPPWRAKRGAGQFREEHFLSDDQIELLATWAANNAPRGPAEDLLPIEPIEKQEWALGEPDLVLTMSEAYDLPADGEDIYRYFVLPMEMAEDKVVVAMDFKPGDPSVVHHCNYFIDYSGRGRQEDAKDPKPGFSVFGTGGFMSYDGANALGGWAPGVAPYELPDGHGFDLPAGGDIILEVHYHLTGRETRDQSSIAFYFAKGPVERGVDALFVGTQDVDIPAGDADYWRHLSMEVPAEMQLVDIAPHMHYLGREAIVDAILPDGDVLPLLHVTDWDLRWQGIYSYRKPVTIPAGSRIEGKLRFDNSADNPYNPHSPPERVTWGWGSDEEMAEFYLTILPKDGQAARQLRRAARVSWRQTADGEQAAQAYESNGGERTTEQWLDQLESTDLWARQGRALLLELSSSNDFTSVLELAEDRAKSSTNPQLHTAVGVLLAYASAYVESPERQWQLGLAADAAFDKALRLDPKNGGARLAKAWLYAESQDGDLMSQAEGMYKRVLDSEETTTSDAQRATTYLQLGRLQTQLGKDKKANETWSEGAKLFPDHPGFQRVLNQ